MGRLLRGAWSRRTTLGVVFLTALVVVAGTLAVVGVAERSDSPVLLAAPLLLIGAVALPATGRQLAAQRREEIALARLRGLRGAALARFVVAEPLLVLVLGAALGALLGTFAASWASRQWLDDPAPMSVSPAAALTSGGVVVVGLVALVAGMVATLREPLGRQLTTVARPRAASVGVIFLQVLLLAAAALAVHRTGSGPADDDWVVLLGPALVGLAAGQAAVWSLLLVSRWSLGWSARRGVAVMLAVRRIVRRAEGLGTLRLTVAAIVVCAVGATGTSAVEDWTDDSARVSLGAPVQVPQEGGALAALLRSRALDPDGRYLMAAVTVPDEGQPAARRVFVDTSRYAAVAGDFLAGTAASDVSAAIDRLAVGAPAQVATGDSVRVAGRVLGSSSDPRLTTVTLTYVNDEGAVDFAILDVPAAPGGAPAEVRSRLSRCGGGCVVTGLSLQAGFERGGQYADAAHPLLLTRLDFAGLDLLDAGWTDPDAEDGPVAMTGRVLRTEDGLEVVLPPGGLLAVVPTPGLSPLPVLATEDVRWSDGPPLVAGPDGRERPARVVRRTEALPLLSTTGLLADLPRALNAAGTTVPAAEVSILAAADTPPEMMAALTAGGGGPAATLGLVQDRTAASAHTEQAKVFLLMGGCCLVVALLAAAGEAARQRAQRRYEAAALRAVGVPTSSAVAAARVETIVVSAWTLIAGVLTATWATSLLTGFPLVTLPPYPLPLDTRTDPAVVVGTALIAVAGVALLGRVAVAGLASRSRPATLREEALR